MSATTTPPIGKEEDLFSLALSTASKDIEGAAGRVAEQSVADKGFLARARDAAVAAGQGVLKAGYEVRDLVAGEPAYADKSEFRRNVEQGSAQLARESTVNALTSGVSQFVTGMVGLGGVLRAAKVGQAATRGGAIAREVAKGAVVGASVIDPHEKRLSDLVESVPALRNPVSAFLAADPKDSEALGRLKNALEGVGLDLALVGTFAAGLKAYRAIRGGDVEAAKAADETLKPLDPALLARMEAGAGPTSPILKPLDPAMVSKMEAEAGPTSPVVRALDPAMVSKMEAEAGPTSQIAPTLEPLDPAMVSRMEAEAGPTSPVATGAPDVAPNIITGRPLSEGSSVPGWPRGTEAWAEAPTAPRAMANDTGLAAAGDEAVTPPAVGFRGPPAEGSAGPPKGRGGGGQALKELVRVDDVQAGQLLRGMEEDVKTLAQYGSRAAAVEDGAMVSGGGIIPWRKLQGGDDIQAFTARLAETLEADVNYLKGGSVLTDQRLGQLVAQRARLLGEDPEMALGMLQQAGVSAKSMAANMEAAYLVANRAIGEAFELAEAIRFSRAADEFGSEEAAMVELKRRMALAGEMFGAARSMTASAGRSLRRMRFGVSPEQMALVQSLDGSALVSALAATKGDPALLGKVVEGGWRSKVSDWFTTLIVNGPLYWWPTHVINGVGNAYMQIARPTERLLGQVVGSGLARVPGLGDTFGPLASSEGAFVRRMAEKEYRYAISSIHDGLDQAVEAFKQGDSILAPRTMGTIFDAASAGGTGQGLPPFRSIKSIEDLTYNATLFLNPRTAITLPVRALGAVDEAMNTIRYRAVIQARAAVEGEDMGLAGEALVEHVRRRLESAFDEAGVALDPSALREARTSTFNQALLEGTLGSTLQAAVVKHPMLRSVFTYVRTPINALRYTIKMTPGLQFVQQEFRDMISGRLGVEAQAQAVGQMSLGALFAAAAGAMAAQGNLTGGGPTDPAARRALQAQGWQPYSYVWRDAQGKANYLPIGRLDPIGMIFGMAADINDIMFANPDRYDDGNDAATALVVALARNITNKSYLTSMKMAVDALSDPERNGTKWLANTASATLPFSALLKGVNPDPYMKEARGFVDQFLQRLPGFSEGIPPRRDAFGDPILVQNGVWKQETPGDAAGRELQRIVEETGFAVAAPAPSREGVDLRDVKLEDGSNSYDKFQAYARQPSPGVKPLRDKVAELIQSDAYKRAPDGSATRGTKLWMIGAVMEKYREAAFKKLMAGSPLLREKVFERRREVADHYKSVKAATPDGGATVGADVRALLDSVGL